MKRVLYTTEKGFTLVETLVAITILLLIVTSPLTISMSSARSTSYASEQVVAFFLAQEGAEIAQKARDEFLLDAMPDDNPADPWGVFTNIAGTYAHCYGAGGCGLYLNTNADGSVSIPPKDCDGIPANLCRLYYDDTPGVRARYTHVSAGNEQTLYTRTIKFSNVSAGDVRVISEVTWRTGTLRQQQSVKIETHLFNIYEN